MSEETIYGNRKITDFHIPRWNELPDIELYIDQVVCYLDNSLSNYVYREKEGNILTKTMINNYVKHSYIKPTTKKKYNREHISNLFIICILKQIYNINDISELIKLATKRVSIEVAYDKFCVELENAIRLVFARKEYINVERTTTEEYIIKNIALSFANKLYVEKKVLKKFSK